MRQGGGQSGQVVAAGLRRRVAPVGEGVQHGADTGGVQRSGEGSGVVLVRVDAAGRDQAQQVAGAAGRFQLVDQGAQRRRAPDRSIGNRLGNARQVLLHHAAGADIHVADLGVAHLALGQPNIGAGGAQERVRTGRPEPLEIGRLRQTDGVIFTLLPPAEPVEDQQHHRTNRLRHALLPRSWVRVSARWRPVSIPSARGQFGRP